MYKHVGNVTLVSLAFVALVLAGCASGSGDSSGSEAIGEDGPENMAMMTDADGHDQAGHSPAEMTADVGEQEAVSQADLARFVAAAEAALAGGDSAGAVFDDPETYIALGQASCARLSDGDSFDDIARSIGVDDPSVTGAVIGAAVETICPIHSEHI